MVFDVLGVPACSQIGMVFQPVAVRKPSIGDFALDGQAWQQIQVLGDAHHNLGYGLGIPRPRKLTAAQAGIDQRSCHFLASGKNAEPFISEVGICLMDTRIKSGSRNEVQAAFNVPFPPTVVIENAAADIGVVVNGCQSLLVAHLPQRGIVARMYSSSIFDKRTERMLFLRHRISSTYEQKCQKAYFDVHKFRYAY